jgi:hypothetical protein
MVRMQVQMEERQMEAVRKMSSASGQSIADLVRQAVNRLLASRHSISRKERIERAKRVVGMFRSGPNQPKDVSTNHDKYWAEATYDRLQKARRPVRSRNR